MTDIFTDTISKMAVLMFAMLLVAALFLESAFPDGLRITGFAWAITNVGMAYVGYVGGAWVSLKKAVSKFGEPS